jgi:peptidylprolyl isomerase
MAVVQSGDKVQIHYTGRLPADAGGQVFDSSEGREPLEFEVGSGQVVEGVDAAVKGMAVGEQKTVTIPPELGYGPHDPERVIQVPRADLPEGSALGTVLGLSAGEHTIPGVVIEIVDDHARIDTNPPLAGRTLVFDIEVVTINDEGKSIIELP